MHESMIDPTTYEVRIQALERQVNTLRKQVRITWEYVEILRIPYWKRILMWFKDYLHK